MKGQTLQEWAGTSRIFALVFTDIVDSTSLGKRLGDERWMELLQKHFAQARCVMEKYDHHEIKIIGDSFMVIFRTAVDALDFALSLNQETGDPSIRIRAGIHLGSARVIGDDIFGNMVNYTKRVEGTENPEGITLSEVAMAQIRDENAKRHDRLQYFDKQVTFKGLPEPQRVFAVKERKPINVRAKTDEGVIDELPPETKEVARRILSWSRRRFSRVEWKDASFVPVLEYGAEYSHNPITVYCRGKVARVGVKFGRMRTRNGLSRIAREDLLQQLNRIPGVNLPQDSIDRYPAILLSTLSNNDCLDQFLKAIEWTIQGVKSTHRPQSVNPPKKQAGDQRPCRVVAVSANGSIVHSTPTRHSRPDLRDEIIRFQRRWLQKKYPSLKSMPTVDYKLQWLEDDEWLFG